MRLSILDFSHPAGAVELAAAAEAAGYTRYWLGEHHSPYQCSNPLLLGAVLALANPNLRVGSGGICLPYHSPLQLAEDARLIESMVPGRFDLGITRGLAQEESLSEALLDGRPVLTREGFFEKLSHLHEFLTGRLSEGRPPFSQDLFASPAPPLWLLGLSEQNARWAAEKGAGFCFSLHHAAEHSRSPLVFEEYYRFFKPSPEFPEPAAMLVVSGICAPTSRELLAWERQMETGDSSRGNRIPRTIRGTPPEFVEALEKLSRSHGVEEIMILDSLAIHSPERLEMYRLIAQELGLAARLEG